MALWLTWVEVVRNHIGYFIAHIGHINSEDNLEVLYYLAFQLEYNHVEKG